MNESNISAAKEQLRLLANNYVRPLRGKMAVLAQLRDELIEL